MFESICTLPLTSELFTQGLHPTEPVLAVGLSAGTVQCFRLPPIAQNKNGLVDSSSSTSSAADGCGQIETQWRTRRHKGSCRTLGFSLDGDTLYSAGTDGLLKAASAESGRVSSKILVPRDA
jgi:WD repeat-containing protein 55